MSATMQVRVKAIFEAVGKGRAGGLLGIAPGTVERIVWGLPTSNGSRSLVEKHIDEAEKTLTASGVKLVYEGSEATT